MFFDDTFSVGGCASADFAEDGAGATPMLHRGRAPLIFDLDGTLAGSRQDIVNAVNFALNKLNRKEKSFFEIVSFIGGTVKDLLSKALDSQNKKLLTNFLNKTVKRAIFI